MTMMSVDGREVSDTTSTPTRPTHLTIAIHSILLHAQTTHGGLAEASSSSTGGDYSQYRAYCTRRLSRLRHAKAVKKDLVHSSAGKKDKKSSSAAKGGRHAFYKLPPLVSLESEEIVIPHENYLLVKLYSAERAWSHSLELKALYDQSRSKKKGDVSLMLRGEKKNSSPGAIRQHFLSKLRRAALLATELETMILRGGCEERTKLESRAYGGWMRGNLAMDMSDWQNACTEYASALALCRNLASGNLPFVPSEDPASSTESRAAVASTLELRDVFTARADNVIQPLLRYCQYELQAVGGSLDQDTLLALMKLNTDDDDAKNNVLKAKFESIQEDKLQNEASRGEMGSVRFRDRDVAVENKALRVSLLRIANLKNELEKAVRNGERGKKMEDKFLALLSGYDDAISIVSDDLQEYCGMKSGPAVNAKRFECKCLLGYVKYEKLKLVMKRNEGMVNELLEKNKARKNGKVGKNINVTFVEDEEEGANHKRIEEIAHLYDALLQDAKAVAELPGGGNNSENKDDDGEIEDEFVLEANANILRIRALRCFYMACIYAADTVAKFAEAEALLDHASSLAAHAAEEIAACQDMEDANDLAQSMADLEIDIRAAKCRAKACNFLSKCGMASSSAAAATGRSLLRRLDDFDSGGKTFCLAHVPPVLEPMVCKPTFFDIANNYIAEFPMEELQKHIDADKQESKGILGWFRRS